ncbi:MAG: hypothetical protein MR294_04885 [Bacteroidales bacterium]|nr:hypothetical protein [Bacteroidales bacterium]
MQAKVGAGLLHFYLESSTQAVPRHILRLTEVRIETGKVGDVIAFSMMRFETGARPTPKPFNPWNKRMDETDKFLDKLMDVDFSHPPMSLD